VGASSLDSTTPEGVPPAAAESVVDPMDLNPIPRRGYRLPASTVVRRIPSGQRPTHPPNGLFRRRRSPSARTGPVVRARRLTSGGSCHTPPKGGRASGISAPWTIRVFGALASGVSPGERSCTARRSNTVPRRVAVVIVSRSKRRHGPGAIRMRLLCRISYSNFREWVNDEVRWESSRRDFDQAARSPKRAFK
jgi:hypothetical protein